MPANNSTDFRFFLIDPPFGFCLSKRSSRYHVIEEKLFALFFRRDAPFHSHHGRSRTRTDSFLSRDGANVAIHQSEFRSTICPHLFSHLLSLSQSPSTNKFCFTTQAYQAYLDKSTPYVSYRWVSTVVLLILFLLRIVLAEGWYIGMSSPPPLSLRSLPSHHPTETPLKPNLHLKLTAQLLQSATPSVSTSSTSSSPSCNPNSTPPSPRTPNSKTATPPARRFRPAKTRSFGPSSGGCQSSSSGIVRRGR